MVEANKDQLRGKFIKENRPDFTGTIANDCKGVLKFIDEGLKSFQYDEEQYKVVLGDQETGEVWDKGKNFSSLRFIQIKDLTHRKSKSY